MPSLHSFRDWFLSRLPGRRDASLVFGVVLFAVFGWSIRGFLFKLPALALYFGLGANLAVLSYMLSFALLESLLVMLVLLAICALLPPRVLNDGFAYKAFLILAVTIIGLIRFEDYYKVEFFKDIMAHNYESISSIGTRDRDLHRFFHRPRLGSAPLARPPQISPVYHGASQSLHLCLRSARHSGPAL